MTDLQRRLEERVQDANYERRIQELRTPFVWPNDPREREIIALALSLAGEAGEFANKVKKRYLKGGTRRDEVRLADLLEELGDIQAYSAMLAHELETNLSEIRASNIAKLTKRKGESSHA
jgi:NTP pyrophosphatase (non-canonical NTP hydrolase)